MHQPDGHFKRQDIWLRSRVSLGEEGQPTLIGPEKSQAVTDGRLVELQLEGAIATGGKLEIAPLISEGGSRLFVRIEEQSASPQPTPPHQGGPVLVARNDRYTALSWKTLEASELEDIGKDNRRPVAADHFNGKTVTLQRIGPTTSLAESAENSIVLPPGQSTSITLQGPCAIRVQAQQVDGTSLPEDWGPTRTVLVGERAGTLEQTNTIQVPVDALWTVDWTSPVNGSGTRLTFEANPNRACIWGNPKGDPSDVAFKPETRRFTAWLAGNGQDLVVPVATGSRNGLLTIEARPSPDPNWSPGQADTPSPVPHRIRYQLETEDGTVLTRGESTAVFEHSRFERRVEPSRSAMSGATRFTIQHPFQATRLRIASDTEMSYRFLAPLNVEAERSSEYALPGGWLALNAPWDLAPYVAINPLDTDTLLAEGRLVRFDATVHPMKRPQTRPEGHRSTRKLTPKGRHQTYPITEQVRRPRGWNQWNRTELRSRTRLRIPPTGTLQISYRLSSLTETSATLRCQDRTFSQVLASSAGTLRFRGLPTGWHTCSLQAPKGSYQADVPGSGRRWAHRNLIPMTDKAITVPVTVPKGGTTAFVRVYTPKGVKAPRLEITIDDGRPKLRNGIVNFPTTPKQRVQPTRSGGKARLLDKDDGSLQTHRGIPVVFGDDLRPGKHTFRIRAIGGDGPVFVRFDSAAGPRPTAESNRRNWYTTEGAQ